MKNEENNVVWYLMYGIRSGKLKANKSTMRSIISENLRRFVHNYIPTPTSPEIKKLTGLDFVKSYFDGIKRKFKGLYLEHIVEVKVLANKYIELALDPSYELTEDGVYKMCIEDYKAVYKLSKVELLAGKDAEIYLPKK